MSSYKTPNLNMHKWDGTDYVKRAEFNDNFTILDTEVGNIGSEVERVSKDAVNPLKREVANLKLYQEATNRIENGVVFGDSFVGSPMAMTYDNTRTTTTEALVAGETILTGKVESVSGFQVGQTITIQDDLVNEDVEVVVADGTNLEVSPLINAYKNKALVARSTVEIDTTTNTMGFGTYDGNFTTTTVTDATIVGSAYDTSGNGGRKTAYLENGWVIAGVQDDSSSPDRIILWKSEDGTTWSQLCAINYSSDFSQNNFSLTSSGNRIYLLQGDHNLGSVYLYNIDATTIANTTLTYTDGVQVDTSQTTMGAVTVITNGSKIYGSASTKNSTYGSSFNIRYYETDILSDGSVGTWSVTQATKYNTSGYDLKNPSIIFEGTIPIIFYDLYTSTQYHIFSIRKDLQGTTASLIDANWSYVTVYEGGSYAQSNPSAISIPAEYSQSGSDEIHVAWHGTDSTDTTYDNVRHAISTDGGLNFTTAKLTSGNTDYKAHPSITANNQGKVFIVFFEGTGNGATTYYNIMKLENNGAGWTTPTDVNTSTTGNKWYPSALFDPTFSLSFIEPLLIYKDDETVRVGFYGTWTVGSPTPLTHATARYTLNTTTDEVVAWVQKDATLTVDCGINGAVATKTANADNTEAQFTHKLASEQTVELALNLTRASATDDVKATKILGGVS